MAPGESARHGERAPDPVKGQPVCHCGDYLVAVVPMAGLDERSSPADASQRKAFAAVADSWLRRAPAMWLEQALYAPQKMLEPCPRCSVGTGKLA